MESYLRAAGKVAALALGDRDAEASEAHYRVPKTASQLQRVDGAPFGTRGGLSVMHTFPADGEYVFRVDLHGNACGFLFGAPSTDEQIEVSVDGERRALLAIDPKMYEGTTSLNAEVAADSRAGRRPPRHRRVPAEVRGAGQRPDGADRPHPGRHADRRGLRHHHDAAPEGPGDRRTAARHRHLGHREPPRGVHLPPDLDAQRAGLRHRDRAAAGHQGLPPPGVGRRLRRPDGLLPERPRGARLRGRHRRRARGDSRQPAVPVPARIDAGRRRRGQRLQAARRRPRLAAVVLPVGHGARRRRWPSSPRRAG